MTAVEERTPAGVRRGRFAVLSLVDQGASSLTNLLAVVLAARLLGSEGFGEFSVVYGISVLAMGAAQAFVGQELVLRRENRPEAVRSAALVALYVGVALGVVLVVAGVLLPSLRAGALVAACTLPLLLVQDCLRYGAAILGRMGFAVMLDLLWLVALLGVTGFLSTSSTRPDAAVLVGAWSGGGALAGLVGLLLLGRLCPPGRRDLARYRRRGFLGYRFVLEFMVVRGSNQVLVVGLGGLVSLVAAGALRGVSTLFGPVNVLVQSVTSFGVPLLEHAGTRRRDLGLALIAAGVAGIAVLETLTLLLLPEAWGRGLLGDTWPTARSVVLPLGLQAAAVGAVAASMLGLRLVRPRATLPVQLAGSAGFLVLVLGGVATAGLVGAAWGFGLGTLLQAVIAAAVYVRVARGSGLRRDRLALAAQRF